MEARIGLRTDDNKSADNLFLSSNFKTAVAQKLYCGFCWNLQCLRRKNDN